MKRISYLCVFILALLFLLTGCGCEHEYDAWIVERDSTCTEEGVSKRVCSKCDEEETKSIELKEHTWAVGMCGEVKVCSVCGAEGNETIQHNWKDATCIEAKTCEVCKDTQGAALGHSFASGNRCSRCDALKPRENCDFRQVKFGDSMDTVKAYETLELLLEREDSIAYRAEIGGLDSLAVYYFNSNDQLYQIAFGSQEKHTNGNMYLTDYENWKEFFDERYGEPTSDKENKGSLYKYCDSKGEALELEEYARVTGWTGENCSVLMGMMSDNYEINLTAYIESTEYSE